MRYLTAILLFVGAHFGMGALIPSSNGHTSWLVPMAQSSESWIPGIGRPGMVAAWLGILAVASFGVALLGLFGWFRRFVRPAVVRPAVFAGLAALIVVYLVYLTAWAALPLALAVAALAFLAWSRTSLRLRSPLPGVVEESPAAR